MRAIGPEGYFGSFEIISYAFTVMSILISATVTEIISYLPNKSPELVSRTEHFVDFKKAPSDNIKSSPLSFYLSLAHFK